MQILGLDWVLPNLDPRALLRMTAKEEERGVKSVSTGVEIGVLLFLLIPARAVRRSHHSRQVIASHQWFAINELAKWLFLADKTVTVSRALLNVWSSGGTCTILRDSEKVFITRMTFRELICIVLFVWPVLLNVCYARRTLAMSCYTVDQQARPMLQRVCYSNKTARLSVAHLSIDDNMDVQYQVYHSYTDCPGDSLYLGLWQFTSLTNIRTDGRTILESLSQRR